MESSISDRACALPYFRGPTWTDTPVEHACSLSFLRIHMVTMLQTLPLVNLNFGGKYFNFGGKLSPFHFRSGSPLPVHHFRWRDVTSGDVTSGDVTSGHVTILTILPKCDLDGAPILLAFYCVDRPGPCALSRPRVRLIFWVVCFWHTLLWKRF